MCIPILTSATVKPARPSLARRVPVVPGRPCPSRPSRRRVRRARRACRHRRPRRARRPRPAHGDPHSSREPPGPTDVAISAGTPRTPSSGFRDPEMSRMCRGPTVDSKNAGIHTRTPGRRGPTVVDRGPRDDLPPSDMIVLCSTRVITAFLTELGEGKLLGPDSAWQRSRQQQAWALHAAQVMIMLPVYCSFSHRNKLRIPLGRVQRSRRSRRRGTSCARKRRR